MGHDLSIRFGGELVAFLNQPLFQRKIVLNDAVVYDYHAAATIAMRVRVLFRGPAVCGPARDNHRYNALLTNVAHYPAHRTKLLFGARCRRSHPEASDGWSLPDCAVCPRRVEPAGHPHSPRQQCRLSHTRGTPAVSNPRLGKTETWIHLLARHGESKNGAAADYNSKS